MIDYPMLDEKNITGNAAPGKDSGNIAAVCKHCKKSNLNDDIECIENEHEIDEEILNMHVQEDFAEMISLLVLGDTEKAKLGLIKSGVLKEKELSELGPKEYGEQMLAYQSFPEILDSKFPQQAVETPLRNLEIKEKKEQDEYKTYLNNLLRGINGKEREKKKATIASKYIWKEKFFQAFPDKLEEDLILFDGKKKIVYDQKHKSFFNDIFASFIRVSVENIQYREYLDWLVGYVPKIEEIVDLYRDYLAELYESSTNRSRKQYFSAEALVEFLKVQVVLSITSGNLGDKIQNSTRTNIVKRITEYNEISNNNYKDFIFHIKEHIRTKILHECNCSFYWARPKHEYRDQYLSFVTEKISQAYNHTHRIDMEDVRIRYKFIEPFNGLNGWKETINLFGSDQGDKLVYDFLNFYTSIDIDDTFKTVIYKHGSDIRIKGTIDKGITDLSANEDETRTIDDDFASFSNPSSCYTAIHTNEGAVFVFDHATTACYASGFSSSISKTANILASKYGLDMSTYEFISFGGNFMVNTRAILVKDLLQEILMIKALNKNWFVKNFDTKANKYRFIYSPGEGQQRTETSEYIAINVEFVSKISTLHNNWKISFSGNKQEYIIPFISMFIGLVEMLENLCYDERFESYINAEKLYLALNVKICMMEKSKVNDSSICQIAKYEITKREVYGNALKESGLTKFDMVNYEDRSKPFSIDAFRNLKETDNRYVNEFAKEEKLRLERWIKFFTSSLIRINSMVGDERFNNFIPNIIREDVPSDEEIQRVYDIKYKNFQIGTAKFRDGGLVHNPEEKEYEVLKYSDGADEWIVGIVYRKNHLFPPMLFLSYPERNSRHPMYIKNGIPLRKSESIKLDNTNTQQRLQSSQRVKETKAMVQEMLKQFTEEKPSKMIFFEPHKGENQSYYNYITSRFPIGSLRSILAQHMWDKSDEEILQDIEKLNVETQQDLIQCIMDAMIMYFDYNQLTKGYVFKLPRHNHWYAVNTEYEKVIFIFRNKEGKHEIIRFESKENTIDINDNIRDFFKSGIFHYEDSKPVKIADLVKICGSRLTIGGQMIDTNGKCVGFRFTEGDKIWDYRVPPQNPVMPPFKEGIRSGPISRYERIYNIKTNTTHIEGLDRRFTPIQKPSGGVKYKVSKIYEESRTWKQQVYIFWRAVVSHWTVIMEYTKEQKDYKRITYENIENYINTYINAADPSRLIVEQKIERMVILGVGEDFKLFEEHLLDVYPNVFYRDETGIATFHVLEKELFQIREYMKRELDIIKFYPRMFYKHLSNTRMNIKLIEKSDNETIGIQNITQHLKDAEIRSNLLTKNYSRHVLKFLPEMDPLFYEKNPKGSKTDKANLITTFFQGKLIAIRIFFEGSQEIAVYACSVWKNEKRILPYNFKGNNLPAMNYRTFYFKNGEIVEAKESKNKEESISITGQDYWILSYDRVTTDGAHKKNKTTMVHAAMLPFE